MQEEKAWATTSHDAPLPALKSPMVMRVEAPPLLRPPAKDWWGSVTPNWCRARLNGWAGIMRGQDDHLWLVFSFSVLDKKLPVSAHSNIWGRWEGVKPFAWVGPVFAGTSWTKSKTLLTIQLPTRHLNSLSDIPGREGEPWLFESLWPRRIPAATRVTDEYIYQVFVRL
jgi:hypothetical protein